MDKLPYTHQDGDSDAVAVCPNGEGRCPLCDARAEVERLTAEVAVLVNKLCDAEAEVGRLKAEFVGSPEKQSELDSLRQAMAKLRASIYRVRYAGAKSITLDRQEWVPLEEVRRG